MEKDRYLYMCDKAEEGREDIFVNHPATSEGGMVLTCDLDQLVVKTSEGKERHWDYRECEETLSRREIFPYR